MLNHPKDQEIHHIHPDDPDMLSVEEAQKNILSKIKRLEKEKISLIDSLGYVLAEDIIADADVPGFDNSAMDGFGVYAKDTNLASLENPITLKVQEIIPAGKIPSNNLSPGNAVRIMTGSAIPKGCDAVIPFEYTNHPDTNQNKVKIERKVIQGENIRLSGEDIKKGLLVLSSGSTLTPPNIGIVASLGKDTVKVYRKPLISILSTGDELVSPGQAKKPGQIYDSNSYSVYAQVIKSGGIPNTRKIVPDNKKSLELAFKQCAKSDLIISTAGVSKGDFDFIKDTINKMGQMDFWSVKMRPGKPLTFGLLDYGDKQVPHIGLPGNPVSALVGFEIFVRPVIKSMTGIKDIFRKELTATLKNPIFNYDGRKVFARVVIEGTPDEGYFANVTGNQNSHILTSMIHANGLAICPEHVKFLKKGDQVKVIMLDSDI